MSGHDEDGAWFAPHRYGYGAGWPIAWQGWLLTGLFIAGVSAATLLLEISVAAYATVLVLLSALFIIIAARTTRGGWRWRWGEKD